MNSKSKQHQNVSQRYIQTQREIYQVEIRKQKKQKQLQKRRIQCYQQNNTESVQEDQYNQINIQTQQNNTNIQMNTPDLISKLNQYISNKNYKQIIQVFQQIYKVLNQLNENQIQFLLNDFFNNNLHSILLDNHQFFKQDTNCANQENKMDENQSDLFSQFLKVIVNLSYSSCHQNIVSLNNNNNLFKIIKKDLKMNDLNTIIDLLIILNNSLISEQTLIEKYEEEGILEQFIGILKQNKIIETILDNQQQQSKQQQKIAYSNSELLCNFLYFLNWILGYKSLSIPSFNFITDFIFNSLCSNSNNRTNQTAQDFQNIEYFLLKSLKQIYDYQLSFRQKLTIKIIQTGKNQWFVNRLQSHCIAKSKIKIMEIIEYIIEDQSMIMHFLIPISQNQSQQNQIMIDYQSKQNELLSDLFNSLFLNLQSKNPVLNFQSIQLIQKLIPDENQKPIYYDTFDNYFKDNFQLKLIQICQFHQNNQQLKQKIFILFIEFLKRSSYHDQDVIDLITQGIIDCIYQTIHNMSISNDCQQTKTHFIQQDIITHQVESDLNAALLLLYQILEKTYTIQDIYKHQKQQPLELRNIYNIIVQKIQQDGLKTEMEKIIESSKINQRLRDQIDIIFRENPSLDDE